METKLTLTDKLFEFMGIYRNTTNFPKFIFDENTRYLENIYDKMVDLCVIISELITINYLTPTQIAILINDYEDELATLRLISETEHYKECELFLIYKIYSTIDLLLEYELYEAIVNVNLFKKIQNIIKDDNTI